MSTSALSIAVVGHTNTGKTSLLRTLTRDESFGEVSDRPAVTRDVAATTLILGDRSGALAEDDAVIELFDTPGLEDSIALMQHLRDVRDSESTDRKTDGIDIIRAFLASPQARTDFRQEAKAIRQVIDSDVALYVIDARDRVLGKHRDELSILNMCARPIVPVLNFVAKPDARTSEWRDSLSRLGLHAVAEFDTVVVDEHSEQRLFEKMRSLLDSHADLLTRLIAVRARQREQLILSSALLIAELLIDAAAFRLTAPTDQPERMKQTVEQLKGTVRRREQRCVNQLLELHRFHPDDCDPSDLPIVDGKWGLDLFNPDALRQFGIRTGSAAAAGAMAGLAIDLAVGGMTLGAATATGAVIGAALSTGTSHGRRLLERLRGRTELRCDDATLLLLATRQIILARALLARGHASQEKLRMRSLDDPSQQAPRKTPQLPPPLRRARARPKWSRLRTADAGSGDTDHVVANGDRDETVNELAELLRPAIKQRPSEPIRLK